MTNRVGILLIFLVWSSFAQAGPKEDALVAYDKLFATFTTNNHDQLAALFAPDALFYGTASTHPVDRAILFTPSRRSIHYRVNVGKSYRSPCVSWSMKAKINSSLASF